MRQTSVREGMLLAMRRLSLGTPVALIARGRFAAAKPPLAGGGRCCAWTA